MYEQRGGKDAGISRRRRAHRNLDKDIPTRITPDEEGVTHVKTDKERFLRAQRLRVTPNLSDDESYEPERIQEYCFNWYVSTTRLFMMYLAYVHYMY